MDKRVLKTGEVHRCGLAGAACVTAHGWLAFFAREDQRRAMLERDRESIATIEAALAAGTAKPGEGRALVRQLRERVARTERMLAVRL